MAINSIQNDVNLTSISNYYLNHPANSGMSDGYWFYYSSSAANNTVGGRKIKAYRWGTPLDTIETDDFFTLEGTIQLVSESLNRGRVFHGSTIARAGSGVNVQTAVLEDDAFFFYHLGDLRATDNVGYWDYAYLPNGFNEWEYFQYHQHQPSVYEDYYGGRLSLGTYTYVLPTDKKYVQMHNIQVKSGNTFYSNILARVHTPSVGGAHNSHFDVELGADIKKNYVLGGTVIGSSDRFHCFYLSENGTQWDVFSRTYTSALNTFSAQVLHGTFDLADPTFQPNTNPNGIQDKFPFRASSGHLIGTDVYVPVIYNGAGGTFDLRIWKFASANTIANASITVTTLGTGYTQRPDCHLTSDGTRLLALVSDVNNGGVDYYKLENDSWVYVDDLVTNGTGDIIRIHGFDFNPTDFRFYTLLSGFVTGSGTYLGDGIYSFEEGEAFLGYKHLSYYTASYGFQLKNELESGYLSHQNINGSIVYSSGSEPRGISEAERILVFEPESPKFFDKKEMGLGGSEFLYGGIQLNDGRLAFVGNILNNINNRGEHDLLFAIYDDTYTDPEFFLTGGDKDDYFTGIVQCQSGSCLWMSGYTKSYLAQKRDIKVHCFGRGLVDGSSKLEWRDMVLDSDGNQYFIGNHMDLSGSIISKYDYNFNNVWQRDLYSNTEDSILDEAYSISIDSQRNLYIGGRTNSGSLQFGGFVLKTNSLGEVIWDKRISDTSNIFVSSVDVVEKNSQEYVVSSVVSGSSTIITVLNNSGSVIEQNVLSNFIVNKVRNSELETGGYFLLIGRDTSTPTKAKIAKGEVLASSDMIKWVRTYASSSINVDGYDIRNVRDSIGDGGLGSLTGPEYIFVGNAGLNGFSTKIVVDENLGNYQSAKLWDTNIHSSSLTSLTYSDGDTYIVGYSSASLEGEGGSEGIILKLNDSGSKQWINTLGHMGDEKLFSVEWDVTGDNLISAGWSESHSDGRRTFSFRNDTTGFGTGNYHLVDFPSLEMWYKSSSLSTSVTSGELAVVSTPTDSIGNLTISSASFTSSLSFYSEEYYDGGNVFDMFIAKVSLDDIAEYKNTEEHAKVDRISLLGGEYVDSLFTFYQWGSAGDGSADDGNFFGYDILLMSGSGKLLVTGQTSGDMQKYNTGGTGVYDYILTVFNPTTEEYEFYQNGTSLDEEIYNSTVMNDGSGSIAFVGRTQGNLGGESQGGYDIFLGIYNPITDVIDYYQTGSGLIDRGFNVHDIGNNQLAIVFETADVIATGSVNQGGLDIGIIIFNYETDLWDSASYMVGTIQDEILSQEGKPSFYLSDSNRIAITGKTLGVFASDGISYGSNDAFLAIFDIESKTFQKYQVGSTGNETPTVVFPTGGDKLLIAGYTDASFEEPTNGFFVSFDASIGVKGKASV